MQSIHKIKIIFVPSYNKNNIYEYNTKYLAAGIAEDDSLSDGESIIQVTQGLQFPFFHLNGDEKLFNTFQG